MLNADTRALPLLLRAAGPARVLHPDAGSAGFGQADRDGLPGGFGAACALMHFAHLFLDKRSRLGRCGLPLALSLSGFL